jgi:hypothetical protein
MAALGPFYLRLCCKSRKLQGHEFFAKTRNGKQSPIRTGAIALSKSPVSSTLGDEVPHIFTRKLRLRPLEFLIFGAKRLLQHNHPKIRHRSLQLGRRLSANKRHRDEVSSGVTLSGRRYVPQPAGLWLVGIHGVQLRGCKKVWTRQRAEER